MIRVQYRDLSVRRLLTRTSTPWVMAPAEATVRGGTSTVAALMLLTVGFIAVLVVVAVVVLLVLVALAILAAAVICAIVSTTRGHLTARRAMMVPSEPTLEEQHDRREEGHEGREGCRAQDAQG